MNIAAFQHAFLAATGRRFSAQEVCELCGASQEGVVRRVVPEGWRECLAAFHEYFEAHYDEQAVPYDGIVELLACVAACRVAYVGDFASDMKAAQAAGVVALGAAWDRGADAAALRAAGALAVFASVGELRDWLSPRA